MSQSNKYRYPGIRNFEVDDKGIFFGRDEDIGKLANLVTTEKSILVYSKSGLGKSSLLNAGLIPVLDSQNYKTYYIRLGLYQNDTIEPVKNILRKTVLQNSESIPKTFLQQFLSRTDSLWYAFKSMQIAEGSSDLPIVLIFDQFEEIDSYPSSSILDFKKQLAEILYTEIPQEYVDAISNDFLLTKPLTDSELDLLYKPLRIKVVFAIRSDRMSVLNELADYLPNILKTFYELKPLSQNQARKAIISPSKAQGDFRTPVFDFQEEALKKILKALASPKNDDNIDTAQLQIILQYVEQEIVEKKNDIDISADDLGDLNKVYEDYYQNSLRKLSNREQTEQAQILIEEKLIVDSRRISYDKGLCTQLVSESTLEKLVETRLIRSEPNSMGGFSYELSHDSLVAPILEIRKVRIRDKEEEQKARIWSEEEQRKEAEYQEILALRIKKQKRQRVTIIITSVILAIMAVITGYAVYARHQAEQAQILAEHAQEQAEQQKLKTEEMLDRLKQEEKARKKMEIDQAKSDIRVFQQSKDSGLTKEAESRIEKLENEIKELERK